MSVDAFIAKQDIRELVLQYCRAIDRRDFDLLATLYADNARDDHGALFSGSGAEYVAWVPGILQKMIVTSHQVMNHYIVVDGDYAEGEVYIQAYHLMDGRDGGRVHMTGGGRYLDKYQKNDGRWQFLHRKIVADYEWVLPADSGAEQDLLDDTGRGGHGKDDPAHDFFTLIE